MQALDDLRFLIGKDIGNDLPDAECGGDLLRACGMVSGEHDDAYAGGLERLNRRGRRRFDRIGDRERAGDHSVDREEGHCSSRRAFAFNSSEERCDVDAERMHQRVVPERDAFPADLAAHALAGERFEIDDPLERQTGFERAVYDRLCERVLAGAFE